MKSLIVFMILMSMGTPVLADIVSPELTPRQREEIRQKRLERFQIRKRQNFIMSTCGFTSLEEITTKKEMNNCKAKLKKEYEETIKLVEQNIKENNNAEKNAKNAAD